MQNGNHVRKKHSSILAKLSWDISRLNSRVNESLAQLHDESLFKSKPLDWSKEFLRWLMTHFHSLKGKSRKNEFQTFHNSRIEFFQNKRENISSGQPGQGFKNFWCTRVLYESRFWISPDQAPESDWFSQNVRSI